MELIMQFQQLSDAERIILAQELWDSVATKNKEFPLSTAQKQLLDERLQDYRLTPKEGDNWEIVKQRITSA
jgi:putative addiction module component (TIGR02574 family)